MDVRRIAFVVSVAMLTATGPIAGGLLAVSAADAPAAAAKADTTAALSAADREKLLTSLKAHKKQAKAERKTASQDAKVQAAYDARIKEFNRLIAGLERSQEFPTSEMNKALESPQSASH